MIPVSLALMSPLSDECALDSLRESLERLCGNVLPECNYYWEAIAVEYLVWSDDVVIADKFCDAEYDLIFDPNPWTKPGRSAAALYVGRSDTPLGYRVTRKELTDMLRQTWMTGEDFYVIALTGRFCGLRTHEDPGSQRGVWLPTKRG